MQTEDKTSHKPLLLLSLNVVVVHLEVTTVLFKSHIGANDDDKSDGVPYYNQHAIKVVLLSGSDRRYIYLNYLPEVCTSIFSTAIVA